MINRRQQQIAIAGAILQLLLAIACYVLTGRALAEIPMYFLMQTGNILLVAALICGLAALHARLAGLAAEEAREASRLSEDGSKLFAGETAAAGRQQRALKQFERALLPIILILLSSAEAALGTWVWRLQQHRPDAPLPADLRPLLAAAALLSVIAFVCFAYGKYCSGLAYGAAHHYLRPVGGVALLGAGAAAPAALAALLGYWNYPVYGLVLTGVLTAAMWILAVERILGWVVDLYRPASRRLPSRPVYESRLLGLFSQPRGLMDNLAGMIDYQFGLKLSEQWLLHAVRDAVLPFAALQVLTLLALTTLVYIRPFERGLLENAFRAEVETLDPGVYLRWPWPLARVHRVPTGRLQETRVAASQPSAPDTEPPAVQLWEAPRFNQGLFLTAAEASESSPAEARQVAPVSLAAAGITVTHSVADDQQYLLGHRSPSRMLALLARRELAHLLASSSMTDLLPGDLDALAGVLRERIQSAADRYGLGVRIRRVTIDHLQPPPQVAPAYQTVIAAEEARERLRLEAEQFAVAALAEADYEANRIRRDAESETVRITRLAAVDSENFRQQLAAYRRYPELYRTRATMERLETWLSEVRKVIIGTDVPRQVISLELKKSRPDLLSTFEE